MTDDRTPAEIEREIEEERHALARSLEDLQATFSPERLMDTATGYMKDNGGEFADRLVNQVKQNPLAAMMAGVGVAWLLASSGKPRPAPTYDRYEATHDTRYTGRGPAFETARAPSPAYDDRTYPGAPGSLSRAPYSAGYDARLEAVTVQADEPSIWEEMKDRFARFTDDLSEDVRETYEEAMEEVNEMFAAAKAKFDGDDDTPARTQPDGPSTWETARARMNDLSAKFSGDTRKAYEGALHDADAAFHSARVRTRHGFDDARHGAYDAYGSVRSGAAERWGAASDAASRTWQDWRDSGQAGIARTRDAQGRLYARSHDLRARLAEGTEGMSDAARERVMRARYAAANAQDALEARLGDAAQSGRRLYDDKPLVGGLIAAAVGALVAAALPRTEVEDEYIGTYRDRAFDEADRVFREEATKIRAVADAAMDEARSVADEKVETAKAAVTGAKEAVPSGKEAVEKAESEVKSAGTRVADAARAEAERQQLGSSIN